MNRVSILKGNFCHEQCLDSKEFIWKSMFEYILFIKTIKMTIKGESVTDGTFFAVYFFR